MRGLIYAILVPFAGVAWCLALWLIVQSRSAATPEQARARSEQHDRTVAHNAAAAERTRQLCALITTCGKYAMIRQECAAAGKPADCIAARMGAAAASVTLCSDDGELRNPPGELPTPLACLLSRATHSSK